jgi:hypothetical protein
MQRFFRVRHTVACTLAPALTFATAMIAGACSDSTGSSGVAASVQVVSGDSQSAVVATPLGQPLIVVVRDSNDKPVVGVQVRFLTSDSGSFSAATVTTDTTGEATTTFTPGKKASTVVVSATVPNILSATFTVTATPAAPSDLAKIAGDNQTAADGTAIAAPIVVQVLDSFGNPVAGVAVTWTTSAGTFVQADAVTDSNGEAKAVLTVAGSSGAETVTAHISGASDVTFTETAQ